MKLRILLLLLPLFVFADIGPRGFSDYPNEYYVETGTCWGGSVLTALKERFRKIYSIESDPKFYQTAQDFLKGYSRVKLWFGDSSTELWNMIKEIDKPITFWLDAHRFPPEMDGKKNCPLIEELEQIQRHPIKTHTILIDDMSCCGTFSFDYLTKEDLVQKIHEINPDYQIAYIKDGDVLAATVPRKRS